MATEDDILKTLLRIEKALGGSTQAAGMGGNRRPRAAGGREAAKPETTADRDTGRTFKATTSSMKSLGDAADSVGKRFSSLSKTVDATRANFVAMNRAMRTAKVAPTVNNIPPNASQGTNRGGGGPPLNNLINSLFGGGGPGGTNPISKSITSVSSSILFAGLVLKNALEEIGSAIRPVVNDFFALHRRGVDATSSLTQLYKNAIFAGMSLGDYTQVLEQSSVVLSRSRSFEDFAQTLEQSREQLAGLGVFGAEATRLSAVLATSSTTLGITQDQLGNAAQRQISVFESLRRTTLLTGEGFQKIIEDLAGMEVVQDNLFGLSGDARAARQAEITQIGTLGLRLGATAEASQALGKAILEQRKATVGDRFKTAGVTRQAGAFLGMNATDIEQLARAQMSANPTVAQAEIIQRVGGELSRRMQQAMNTGDLTTQNIIEQLQSRMGGGMTAITAAGRVAQTAESGPAGINAELGRRLQKGADDHILAAGKWLSIAQGLMENPLAESLTKAVGSVLGSAAFALGIGTIVGRVVGKVLGQAGISGGLSGIGGLPLPGGTGGTAKGARGKLGSLFNFLSQATNPRVLGTGIKNLAGGAASTVGGVAGRAGGAVRAGAGSVGQTFGQMRAIGLNPLQAALGTGVDIAATLSTSLAGGIKSILMKGFSFLGKGGILSALFGGVAELFSGDLSAALGATDEKSWFGDGLKGFLDKLLPKIGDITGAMIRGFVTGITGMGDFLIDAWNWTVGSFFKDMRVELTSSFTNMFDRTWTSVLIMFKEARVKLYEALGMTTWAEEVRKDIEVAKKTQAELEKDGQATISSIGDRNQKLLEQQKKTAAETNKNIGVATKSTELAGGVVTNTKNLAEAALGTASRIVATPGQTQRPVINTQSTVNTPAEEAAATAAPQAAAGPGAALTTPDTVTQLNTVIGLLTQMLAAEQAQVGSAQTLASMLNRPLFSDNSVLMDRSFAA